LVDSRWKKMFGRGACKGDKLVVGEYEMWEVGGRLPTSGFRPPHLGLGSSRAPGTVPNARGSHYTRISPSGCETREPSPRLPRLRCETREPSPRLPRLSLTSRGNRPWLAGDLILVAKVFRINRHRSGSTGKEEYFWIPQ